MALDLDDRFFSLEDAQGREGKLVYFCCVAKVSFSSRGRNGRCRCFFARIPAGMPSKKG